MRGRLRRSWKERANSSPATFHNFTSLSTSLCLRLQLPSAKKQDYSQGLAVCLKIATIPNTMLDGLRILVHRPKQSPEAPTLAESRLHKLTPSPSREYLGTDPQTACRFFALSSELRIAILTAAFGERTLHIRFYEPKTPQPKKNGVFLVCRCSCHRRGLSRRRASCPR